MTRSRSVAFLAGAAVIPLALAVGCGGDDGGGSATASTPPPKTTSTRSATVRVANTHFGKILVDAKGRTLYLFTK
jgi:predicted lipoprotein with Yx(FWY)xxD motif